MIGAPDNTGARLRAALPSEADALQAVWEASDAADDPSPFWRGPWSLRSWATRARVLDVGGQARGLVAVRDELAPDAAMPARIALDVSLRTPQLAALLVQGVQDLVADCGGELARLFVASRAEWAREAARRADFEPVRSIAQMLMPADVPTPHAPAVQGLAIRRMGPEEDERVLAALNRAWADTWNFVSIPLEMLAEDLDGQREGMLLGVIADRPDEIIATCHAIFNAADHNPDGNPRAWISNLTVDPGHRQRGIARSMLAAGIAELRARGGRSIALGVDAHNPAPFHLYRSVGFDVLSAQEAWDKPLV